MKTPTYEEYDELSRKLGEKATPRPWGVRARSVYAEGSLAAAGAWPHHEFLQYELTGPEAPSGRGDFYGPDAALIAHNREAADVWRETVGHLIERLAKGDCTIGDVDDAFARAYEKVRASDTALSQDPPHASSTSPAGLMTWNGGYDVSPDELADAIELADRTVREGEDDKS